MDADGHSVDDGVAEGIPVVVLYFLLRILFCYEQDIVREILRCLSREGHTVVVDSAGRCDEEPDGLYPTDLPLTVSERGQWGNVYLLLDISVLQRIPAIQRGSQWTGRIEDLPDGPLEIVGSNKYEEDGYAGDWEGSGYGACASIRTERSHLMWDGSHVVMPLEDFQMESSGYSHCSCNGASTSCELTGSGCSVEVADLERWLYNADVPPSVLSGTIVEETDHSTCAENNACMRAMQDVLGYDVVVRFSFPFTIADVFPDIAR